MGEKIATMGQSDNQQPRIICICGRPLSGKTTTARLLRESFGWPMVEADSVGLAAASQEGELAHFALEADGTERCLEYPYHDALLVEWERPDTYCHQLLRVIRSLERSVLLLVGLRSMSLLSSLRRVYPRRVALLYVAAGTRLCSRRYAARTRSSQQRYFRLLSYAIETDQGALRRAAQFVVVNVSTPEALRDRLLARIRDDGRISRSPLGDCSYCGRYAPVHFRTPGDKAPVCRECYEIHYNAEPCAFCRQVRPVHKRSREGAPMCKNCYQKLGNVRLCARCGKARPVHRRDEHGNPLCRRCGRH